jgi:hypothetical protein
MAAFRSAVVSEVIESGTELLRVRARAEDREIEAVGFPRMLGPVALGDRIIVNTTGIELELGTGGVGFILWNLDSAGPPPPGPGHIVKLRYTPWQTEVLAAEASESRHHDRLATADSIDGMAVVASGLHSQVAGIAAGMKQARPAATVGYLMTDGGALPLAWSRLVRDLKAAGLIDVTCTAGHAFGGDLETVNVFSGLVALRHAAECDMVIAALGPGVVGTGTALGFSGIEQGQISDAAGALGGRAIASIRLSFSDGRARHHGVSHHTMTALCLAAQRTATVVVPRLSADHEAIIAGAVTKLARAHHVVVANGEPGVELLRTTGIEVSSMGLPLASVPELFLAAAAAGSVAASKEEEIEEIASRAPD